MAIGGGTGGPTGGGGEGSGGGGAGGGGNGPDTATENPGQPAVHEEQLLEARAELAESKVEELESKVKELEAALTDAVEGAAAAERRSEMERLLREANTVDVQTAMLLTEIAVMGMDSPDIAVAVAELQQSKPFLFRSSAGRRMREGAGSAMSAGTGSKSSVVDLGSLAEDARSSGDRSALLRYLRGRRAV